MNHDELVNNLPQKMVEDVITTADIHCSDSVDHEKILDINTDAMIKPIITDTSTNFCPKMCPTNTMKDGIAPIGMEEHYVNAVVANTTDVNNVPDDAAYRPPTSRHVVRKRGTQSCKRRKKLQRQKRRRARAILEFL